MPDRENLTGAAIDADLAQMADDRAYQEEAMQVTEDFATADWEAFRTAAEHDVGVRRTLAEHNELWEDFYHILLAKEREHEPRETLAEVKRKLGVSSD